MRNNKIKAVLFDFGETLVNFGKVDTTRLFRQGARLSYEFLKDCRQPVGNFTYYCWKNLLSIRMHCWKSHITGIDFDASALLKKIGEKRSIQLTEQQWQHLGWLWYEPLSKIGKPDPNTAEVLTTLKNMGIKLGIVSNTFVNRSSLEKHLQQLGMLDFFGTRLYSYQFSFRKPDTRIFKIAAELIGELPENIMFVGDRIDKDIDPAKKLGMTAVLKAAYTNEGKSPPEGVLKIDQLAELPALIEKINGEPVTTFYETKPNPSSQP